MKWTDHKKKYPLPDYCPQCLNKAQPTGNREPFTCTICNTSLRSAILEEDEWFHIIRYRQKNFLNSYAAREKKEKIVKYPEWGAKYV